MAQCTNDLGGDKQVSGIPGNIGVVNSKAIVWDHDPFWARPHQCYSFPFSSRLPQQTNAAISGVKFQAGGVLLQETNKLQDMYICTRNVPFYEYTNPLAYSSNSNVSSRSRVVSLNPNIDLVGSEFSGRGSAAYEKLPGGPIYECDAGKNVCNTSKIEVVNIGTGFPLVVDSDVQADNTTGKSIFPHQLWVHIGNLFDGLVYRNPSEYNTSDLGAIIALRKAQIKGQSQTEEQINDMIESSAVWDYVNNTSNGKSTIWLQQTTKRKKYPVHWSIEKYSPVWQGEDFIFSFKLQDSITDDTSDPAPNNLTETIQPRDTRYSYLMYMPSKKPSDDILQNIDSSIQQDTLWWLDGVSNEAFYEKPKPVAQLKGEKNDPKQPTPVEAAIKSMREQYNWKYKTYILIELGPNNSNHRYFIEIVKGRSPRFLCLAPEWDNINRLQDNSENANFMYVIKCRALSIFNSLNCDELFNKDEFSFSVRNHLGKIVITFKGYENIPWVVYRKDNIPYRKDYSKRLVPMVVPNDTIRIHGGNISCQINWSPMEYYDSGLIGFNDRQIDGYKLKDSDLFMTFSEPGYPLNRDEERLPELYKIFKDKRWRYEKIGYSNCDAFYTSEIVENTTQTIPVYELHNSTWASYGKGYMYQIPYDQVNFKYETDSATGKYASAKSSNKMSPVYGGKPHSASIYNLYDYKQTFSIMKDKAEPDDHSLSFNVGINLNAGTVSIDPPYNKIDPTAIYPAKFINCVTPVLHSWRIVALGGGKPIFDNISNSDNLSSSSIEPFDISPLILELSDSWQAENLSSLNHEMTIKCYIPSIPSVAYSETNQDNLNKNPDQQLYNLGQKIRALHDKTFYITVSYWWDTGVGKREVPGNILNNSNGTGKKPKRQSTTPSLNKPLSPIPKQNPLLIQMTGLAYGGQFEESANRVYITFQVKDYMSIFKHQLIFNSPFFDAVSDTAALYELGQMAGFDDSLPLDNSKNNIGIDRRPLGLLQKCSEMKFSSSLLYNGETVIHERYDLPGSYADLAEPAVRFNNGDTYESAIKRIAEMSGKCVFFDRWGVLRLETLPSILAATVSNGNDFTPVMEFFTTPLNYGPDPSTFDPSKNAAQLAWNSWRFQRSVEDCVNQVVLMTVTSDERQADGTLQGGFLIEGQTLYNQIFNPNAEGFIGYRKPFYQSNGAMGGLKEIRNSMSYYLKMTRPPVIISFEAFGVPGLKALDIISLNGNKIYITEISHNIDPASNKWWMNITGEWLLPYEFQSSSTQEVIPTNSTGAGNGGN